MNLPLVVIFVPHNKLVLTNFVEIKYFFCLNMFMVVVLRHSLAAILPIIAY